MINQSIQILSVIVTSCILFFSCKKDFKDSTGPNLPVALPRISEEIAYDGPTILGEQLINPYTVERMQEAKDQLTLQGIASEKPVDIRETHLYVKFSPRNEEEFEVLHQDSSVTLYDRPLDYLIIKHGTWYREPGIPDSVPTPQYAAVKAGYTFNQSIPYEILSSLYIPEEDQTLVGEYLNENHYYMRQLVNMSLRRIGGFVNLEPYRPYDPVEPGHYEPVGPRAPNGVIRIFDTRLNQLIPMEGVEITANRWFTTHNGFTNANGEYWLDGSFTRPSDFTIWFERPHFAIAKNRLQRAKITASNVSNNHWSYDINDGLDRMHGHMFRAAYRYCYKDNGGLKRPFIDLRKIIIVSQNNTGHYWGAGVNSILLPYLFITRNRGNGNEYDSDEIFSTTAHEIAHTTHVLTMNGGPVQSSQVNEIIRESWAVGVEWLITGIEYRERGIQTYGDRTYSPISNFNPPVNLQYPNRFAYQYWTLSISQDYTSLFINLMDNFNESGINLNTAIDPVFGQINDQVNNYNLSTIENLMLKHVYGLSSLGIQLRTYKPAGVTDVQINLLLGQY